MTDTEIVQAILYLVLIGAAPVGALAIVFIMARRW